VARQRASAEERDPAGGCAQRAGRHDRSRASLAEIGTTRLPPGSGSIRVARSAANLASAVEQVERDLIQAALDRADGNISESARALGLTRRGLYLKIRRLGLDSEAEVDTQ